ESGAAERLSENVPSEILPLVREVNHLLASLSRRVERSRHALGDLAHAVKTPLQLLQQALAAPTLAEPRLSDARSQAARIRDLVQRELKRARLAGATMPAQRYSAATQLPDLCATLQQVHRERRLTIDTDIATALAPFGDAEDIQELLGNLLDNACKWAAQRVEVAISGDDSVLIRVSDDGAGLSEAEIADITRRGVRLDEASSGHGLGLAIVSDIVAAYDGTLVFMRDPRLGGLCVEVRLPATGSR
ncbi:unnamed protein product, partial [Phaeothamnion confervicola]